MKNLMHLLAVLFVGLKLTNHITWSWIWVLSPLWLPISVSLFLLLLIALIVWGLVPSKKEEFKEILRDSLNK